MIHSANFAAIDSRLREADASWRIDTLGVLFWALASDYPGITLLDIERRLRCLPSKTTYLVAKSLDHKPDGLEARLLDGRDARWWLWICLNGFDEMLMELAKSGLTMMQNLEALEHTGMLVKAR